MIKSTSSHPVPSVMDNVGAEKKKMKRSLFIGWDTVSKLSTKPHEYMTAQFKRNAVARHNGLLFILIIKLFCVIITVVIRVICSVEICIMERLLCLRGCPRAAMHAITCEPLGLAKVAVMALLRRL